MTTNTDTGAETMNANAEIVTIKTNYSDHINAIYHLIGERGEATYRSIARVVTKNTHVDASFSDRLVDELVEAGYLDRDRGSFTVSELGKLTRFAA